MTIINTENTSISNDDISVVIVVVVVVVVVVVMIVVVLVDYVYYRCRHHKPRPQYPDPRALRRRPRQSYPRWPRSGGVGGVGV